MEETRHPLFLSKRRNRVKPRGEFLIRKQDVKLSMAGRTELRRGQFGDFHALSACGRFGSEVMDGGAGHLPLAKLATRIRHLFKYAFPKAPIRHPKYVYNQLVIKPLGY